MSLAAVAAWLRGAGGALAGPATPLAAPASAAPQVAHWGHPPLSCAAPLWLCQGRGALAAARGGGASEAAGWQSSPLLEAAWQQAKVAAVAQLPGGGAGEVTCTQASKPFEQCWLAELGHCHCSACLLSSKWPILPKFAALLPGAPASSLSLALGMAEQCKVSGLLCAQRLSLVCPLAQRSHCSSGAKALSQAHPQQTVTWRCSSTLESKECRVPCRIATHIAKIRQRCGLSIAFLFNKFR